MRNTSTLVKVGFRTDCNKDKLNDATCLLHISVGQDYHEGEKFLATMDLINQTFSSVHIVVCDTLQRHSLMIANPKLSHSDAIELAKRRGDDWIARNNAVINAMTIPVVMTRWDGWLNHADYDKYKLQIMDLYEANACYQQAVNETIDKYLLRQQLSRDEHAKKLCLNYLLEESPILIPLWAMTKLDFIVYPRKRTKAMSVLYDIYHELCGGYLQEVSLKFNHRKQPKKLSLVYTEEEIV